MEQRRKSLISTLPIRNSDLELRARELETGNWELATCNLELEAYPKPSFPRKISPINLLHLHAFEN